MQKVDVEDTQFLVPKSYNFLRVVGQGAYGTVAAFRDESNRKVAIKKIGNFTDDLIDGRRIVREIRLLQQLHHPCLLSIYQVLPPKSVNFSDVYITSELMDTDLHHVIYSKQPITLFHMRWWMAQLFRGLQFLHEANVIHRDLKPSNLLVNMNCDLKIADFGLARVIKEDSSLTAYVCTRWYRAPEVIFTASQYSYSLDMWSAGCILAEMMNRKPLFPGKDHIHQIRLILERLGAPGDDDREWIGRGKDADRALSVLDMLVDNLDGSLKWDDFIAEGEELDMVRRLVTFNPKARLTAADALLHPYIRACAIEQEPTRTHTPPVVDWSFDEQIKDKQSLRTAVFSSSNPKNVFIQERAHDEFSKRGLLSSVLSASGV